MKKWGLSIVLLLLVASASWAEEVPAKTTTVGGGVPNPWRSPYRTCLTAQPVELAH